MEADERAQSGKRHKQKRRGALRRLYVMVLFFMLTIGVVLIFTVFFKVKTVEVLGVTRYLSEDIVVSSGIEPGVNMFRLNRTGICNNLVREYSYIKEARLQYTLPDTVTILVTEAEPAGAVKQGGSYVLFSAENRVLETGVAAPPKNVPIVKGFSEAMGLTAGAQMDVTDETALGDLNAKIEELEKKIAGSKSSEKVLVEKRAELDELKRQAQAVTDELAARRARITVLDAFFAAQRAEGFTGITAIDVTDPYNLVVNRGSRVEVLLGSEADLAAKVKLACRVLTNELDDDFEGRIDASFAGKAYVTQMDLTSQNMTADEYAKLLYETSSSEAQSSASEAPAQAATQQPAAQASAAAAPEVPASSADAAPTEEDTQMIPAEEDFIAGVEE